MRKLQASLYATAVLLSMAGPVSGFWRPMTGQRFSRSASPLFSRVSSRQSTRVWLKPGEFSNEVADSGLASNLLALLTKPVQQVASATSNLGATIKSLPTATLVAGIAFLGLIALGVPGQLLRGWRSYNREENSVGREYDAWTREKILEHYWGEHIHLGYYSEEVQKQGYLGKNFIEAKYDFIDRMMDFARLTGSGAFKPKTVLDVGCGIGGTTRYLAKKVGSDVSVQGITLSKEQVRRAKELAEEQNVPNAKFAVMDALHMDYPDNSFDLVWACESGEHMPDKKAYVEEMVRVLKPGGTLVIACWCQRDNSTQPFTPAEQKRVDFMCTEWSHPYFISIKDFERLALDTGVMENTHTEDWAKYTIPSWRHSVWVGVFDPIFWMLRPHLWIKILRDAWTLNVFHNAFKDGLMGYGMIYGTKKRASQ